MQRAQERNAVARKVGSQWARADRSDGRRYPVLFKHEANWPYREGVSYHGRIAPSPTGYLHLGHARTFLMAAQRAHGGTLILRNEDLDTQRVRPTFVQAMLEDLDWLGLRWAEGPQLSGGETGSFGPYAQSQRRPLYRAAFERLRATGAVFPCICSRRDLAAAVHAPHAEDEDEPLYPGTCRSRPVDQGVDQSGGDGNDGCAWRFRVPDGEELRFDDALLGPQAFTAGRDFGDFLVMRRDGVPSYQLACVVDDAAMGITEVVRGRDLLRSTARQMLLQRALRLPQPAYAHCALVVNEAGIRLAKRDASRSLRALREAGRSAGEVRAMALEQPS